MDLSLVVHAGGGLASAQGGFFDERGGLYAELGAASYAAPGSWSMDPFVAIGGLGADLVLRDAESRLFFLRPPFSAVIGADLGLWGGGLSGFTSSGQAFAWAEARALLLSLRAWIRAEAGLGAFSLYAELGPELGSSLAYHVADSVSGVQSTTFILVNWADLGFLALGGGLGFDLELGRTRWGLELCAEYGLVRLAASSGALGASLEGPWRVQARVTAAFPLENKR
jgi:hypothetical protein